MESRRGCVYAPLELLQLIANSAISSRITSNLHLSSKRTWAQGSRLAAPRSIGPH